MHHSSEFFCWYFLRTFPAKIPSHIRGNEHQYLPLLQLKEKLKLYTTNCDLCFALRLCVFR